MLILELTHMTLEPYVQHQEMDDDVVQVILAILKLKTHHSRDSHWDLPLSTGTVSDNGSFNQRTDSKAGLVCFYRSCRTCKQTTRKKCPTRHDLECKYQIILSPSPITGHGNYGTSGQHEKTYELKTRYMTLFLQINYNDLTPLKPVEPIKNPRLVGKDNKRVDIGENLEYSLVI